MFKQKSDTVTPSNPVASTDPVQQARSRARQRLIGAIVLLAVGIIGFPLVFETQPRPIPVDIPIEIPRRDGLPPLAMAPARRSATLPASAPVSGVLSGEEIVTEPGAEAGRPVTAPPRPASSARAAAMPERAASRASARSASAAEPARRLAVAAASGQQASLRGAASAVPARSAGSAPPTPLALNAASDPPQPGSDGQRALALLEGRASTGDGQRFVVQVGAFADAEAAREARKAAEKLGLKTYTQVAQTAAGNRVRVRVGPFASRGEAEAALAKARTAGLSAVVLTL